MNKKLTGVLLAALMVVSASTLIVGAEETVEEVTLNVAYMPNYGALWSIENIERT